MGKRKDKYYTKKPAHPQWNLTRKYDLIYRNVKRMFENKKFKFNTQQLGNIWMNQRKLTIPASLVRKALNGSDKFLDYYDIGSQKDFGHEFEALILELFKNKVKSGYQVFSSEVPWLSSTPDGFFVESNLPIEIKTKLKGSIEDVINAHYHQLQFTMFTASSLHLIVIIYIIGADFQIIRLSRDEQFIRGCLRRLEYAFYKYLIPGDHNIDIDCISNKIDQKGYFLFISTINEKPVTHVRNRRTKVFEIITKDFLEGINTMLIEDMRYIIKEEAIQDWRPGEYLFGEIKYKYEKIKMLRTI